MVNALKYDQRKSGEISVSYAYVRTSDRRVKIHFFSLTHNASSKSFKY